MPQIQHLVTPVNRSHPWRGADLAQHARSQYVSMGDGSGIWVALGTGQIYFKGSHTIVTPTNFTIFDPTADFTPENFADFVVEGDNEVQWAGDASAFIQIAWSITLSHTDAASRKVSVVCAPSTGVAGYEKLVQDADLAQNVNVTLSGRTIKQIAHDTKFHIYAKVPAGNLTVVQARMSMSRVN